MKLDTQAQVDAAERILRLSWVIVAGAVLFSVLTVTPLVQRVTPEGWGLTAPILPIVVDAAVVIVVRVDAIVARLDGDAGFWPALLRWLTGLMTLALNVGDSALKGDLVGVGVHAVAPILLIVTAEAGLKWRRAITTAIERIEREHQAGAEREREQEAARQERERQEAAARERREQEAAEREREREHAARIAREEREHAATLERERLDREERARREEQERIDRERREEQERQERERREQEAARKAKERAQQAERDRKTAEGRKPALASVSAAVSTPRPAVSATAHEAAHDADKPAKMSEADARQAVADAVREGRSQRQVAALTGWSVGWVAARFKELEEDAA